METNPIKAKELKAVLHRWLDETDVKCACAIGIKNLTKGYQLENPRVYLSGGKTMHEPIAKVEPENASAGFFTKTEYAPKGTSGCLCYGALTSLFFSLTSSLQTLATPSLWWLHSGTCHSVKPSVTTTSTCGY
jgi:hypothetical protein